VSSVAELVEEARLFAEELPVHTDRAAANAYQAIQSLANAVELLGRTEAEVRQGEQGGGHGVGSFRTFEPVATPTPAGATPETGPLPAPSAPSFLNEFHRLNFDRQREAFAPPHPLTALVVCVQEEVGELAGAVLGVTGEKKRKAHKTREDVLDAVADAMTYLSLVASNVGCFDLEGLLADTFNMVSDRAGSAIKVRR
jgi:hypothetical protein